MEKALEKYQFMLLMDPEELEPKVTASFQLAPSAPTNEFHSTTEDTVIRKIETDTMSSDSARVSITESNLMHSIS